MSIVLPVLASCIVLVTAKLGHSRPFSGVGQVRPEDLDKDLLAELMGTFRPSATHDRLERLEARLRPMVTSLPKNANGTLAHPVVRYILHRYFTKHHGWSIRGLEPESDAWNASSPTGALEEWVPAYILRFLEQLFGGRSLNLRELSVLAATLEDIIHKEAVERLKVAYKFFNIPLDGVATRNQVKEILEIYMMNYLSNFQLQAETRAEIALTRERLEQRLRNWNATAQWVRNEIHPLIPADEMDFNSTARIVEELGERFHKLNEVDCADLRSALLQLEGRRPGRVPLSVFYKKAVYSAWYFNEKLEYLRDLGVLDESGTHGEPEVIVTNYVSARHNCLKASNYYLVCCGTACEDLMAKLEARIQGSSASPARIAALVTEFSTELQPAPQKLTPILRSRLDEVAARNGGVVPLHGRLFALWMHHVFPRDCPYPHQRGSTNPQTPDAWMAANGKESNTASEDEVASHLKAAEVLAEAKAMSPEDVANSGTAVPGGGFHGRVDPTELPWSGEEEELLIIRPSTELATEGAASKHKYRFLVFPFSALGFVLAWKNFPIYDDADGNLRLNPRAVILRALPVMLIFVVDLVLDEFLVFACAFVGFLLAMAVQQIHGRRQEGKDLEIPLGKAF